MTGPHADQPVRISYADECVLQATVALHTNRGGPNGVCFFCGVRNCERSRWAIVVLRSAGIPLAIRSLETWASGG